MFAFRERVQSFSAMRAWAWLELVGSLAELLGLHFRKPRNGSPMPGALFVLLSNPIPSPDDMKVAPTYTMHHIHKGSVILPRETGRRGEEYFCFLLRDGLPLEFDVLTTNGA